VVRRHGFAGSRATPRGMSKNEGARAPNDRHPSNNPAAFRRPRAAAAVPRVLSTSSAGLGSHPAAFRAPGYRRSGPLAAALHKMGSGSAAARRASVRAVASLARPRSPAPESEVSFTSRRPCERKARPPQPGTVPAPRQTLKLAASLGVGRDGGSMGRVQVAGISLLGL
jgi:hypothetical protein